MLLIFIYNHHIITVNYMMHHQFTINHHLTIVDSYHPCVPLSPIEPNVEPQLRRQGPVDGRAPR